MTSAIELAAHLVTEGCLPMIAGREPSGPAPQGAALSPHERAAAGFREPGVTMRYGAADAEVIADFGAQTATIRLDCADVAPALAALDTALRRAAGDLDMREDPDVGGRVRVYMARLSQSRYARVAVRIPQAAQARLDIRVSGLAALERRGGAPP